MILPLGIYNPYTAGLWFKRYIARYAYGTMPDHILAKFIGNMDHWGMWPTPYNSCDKKDQLPHDDRAKIAGLLIRSMLELLTDSGSVPKDCAEWTLVARYRTVVVLAGHITDTWKALRKVGMQPEDFPMKMLAEIALLGLECITRFEMEVRDIWSAP